MLIEIDKNNNINPLQMCNIFASKYRSGLKQKLKSYFDCDHIDILQWSSVLLEKFYPVVQNFFFFVFLSCQSV